jgi:hypothetical protein
MMKAVLDAADDGQGSDSGPDDPTGQQENQSE